MKEMSGSALTTNPSPQPKNFAYFAGENSSQPTPLGNWGFLVGCWILNLLFRHRPHRPALDELRFGEALPPVIFALSHVVRPAHDPAQHRAVVPADVGDRGLAPDKIRIGVGAEQ